MTEKGCDNCYYTYFDERAYPCSLCIRGIERTDQWQPSKKTKAEPQTEKPKIRKRIDKPFRAVWLDDDHNEIGTPQTERSE